MSEMTWSAGLNPGSNSRLSAWVARSSSSMQPLLYFECINSVLPLTQMAPPVAIENWKAFLREFRGLHWVDGGQASERVTWKNAGASPACCNSIRSLSKVYLVLFYIYTESYHQNWPYKLLAGLFIFAQTVARVFRDILDLINDSNIKGHRHLVLFLNYIYQYANENFVISHFDNLELPFSVWKHKLWSEFVVFLD